MAKTLALIVLWVGFCGPLLAGEPSVQVLLPKDQVSKPQSGRLLVLFSRSGEPRLGPNWFRPEPFFGKEVRDWQPGTSQVIDARAEAFPQPLTELSAGTYRVQAVLDQKFHTQHHGKAAGNLYSPVAEWEFDPEDALPLKLELTKRVGERSFPKGKFIQPIELNSKLLSEFHGHEVPFQAAVVLPESYYEAPQRRYPVIYRVPGFSGSHRQALGYPADGLPSVEDAADFILVMLSGQCAWGHHVYADSATNGPRGKALVEELIPHIDQTYRTIAKPTARFVTGHSSGGWSSLWLQVNYPETFGGVWSTSPDPVNFRDYQQVNLYADPPLSLYFTPDGEKRPLARIGGEPVLWYADFGKMDDVLGRGGQLRSFEAVFSPLNEDGNPQQLWDRKTGKIDPEVAKAWQKYDISLMLQRNWATLGPQLQGKLHIFMGDQDTFYLEGATILLAERLEKLGSDAEVTIIPDGDHGILDPDLRLTIRRQMSEQFWKHHKRQAE